MRAEGAERCTAADKDHIGVRLRSAIVEIRHQRLSHFIGQRQSRLTPSLPADVNPGALPVDIAQPKLHDVAGAKTQTSEQQQNRSITLANVRSEIARRDDALHIVRRQVSRERGKTPVRQDGDGPIQSAGAFTFCDQKPEEHPKSRRALLGGGPPTRTTALHDKLSQAPRIPRDWLLAKACEQLANVNPVIGQGAFTRPALLVHPLAEAHDQRRSRNDALDHRALDQARILRVFQEQASAVQYLQTERMAEVRTSASSPQVGIESLKSRPDWTADRNARSICPIDKVLCRSEVSAGRDLRVTALGQRLRERFEQRPRRSITEVPESAPLNRRNR